MFLEKWKSSVGIVDLILIQGASQLLFFRTAQVELKKNNILLNPVFIIGELSTSNIGNAFNIAEYIVNYCIKHGIKFINFHQNETYICEKTKTNQYLVNNLNELGLTGIDIRSIWYTQNWTNMAFEMHYINRDCLKICYGDKGMFCNKKNGIKTDICISPYYFPLTWHSIISDKYWQWNNKIHLQTNLIDFDLIQLSTKIKVIGIILLYDTNNFGGNMLVQKKWIEKVLLKMPDFVYLKNHPRQNCTYSESIMHDLKIKFPLKEIEIMPNDIFVEFVDYSKYKSITICAPLSTEFTRARHGNVKNINLLLFNPRLWLMQVSYVLYKKHLEGTIKSRGLVVIIIILGEYIFENTKVFTRVYNKVLKLIKNFSKGIM